jgi:hypothetical protein
MVVDYSAMSSGIFGSLISVRRSPTCQGAWPVVALQHSHGMGAPSLRFFARVGGDDDGATLVRSTLPVVYGVVVPALRKVREDGVPEAVVASAL